MVDEGLQRRQKAVGGFATQKEALKAMRAELTPIDEGRHVNPADMTVRAYVEDEWLPIMRSGKRKTHPGGLGEHSLANVRAVLHRVLSDAVRSHLLPRSPADDVSECRRMRR
jgi:hypothetical protein